MHGGRHHEQARETPSAATRTATFGSPFVSVIVPVRDNPDGMLELLDCLAAQTLPRDRFEVVVGDDGSRDDSCEALATDDGWVRIARGPRQTSYAGRNRAVNAARGDVLAFCDSDCLPRPEWLQAGLAALEGADVVAGHVTFLAPDRPTVWSLLTIDMFLDQERNVVLSRGVTANLFLRRSLFEALGGFDPSLPSGGDYELVGRAVMAGARLAYAPDSVVLHPTLDERRAFLRKIRATNRWSAVRKARNRERPELSGVLALVPVLGVALARRQALRPIWKLQRSRFQSSGLDPSSRSQAQALSLLYSVVAYAAGFARARGWIEGRRLTHVPRAGEGAGGPASVASPSEAREST
jgi:GT2 family glycosyltransferase